VEPVGVVAVYRMNESREVEPSGALKLVVER
jgi:hypothetical protein